MIKGVNDLVTIIVPVYNAEKYIVKCVESLINQTYKNTEIFLIDDGSVDKSSEICDIFCQEYEKIKTFHKTNGGVSSARNFGLKMANGKYIMFVDSDDSLDEKYVENMLLGISVNDLIISKIEIIIGEKQRSVDFDNEQIINIKELNVLFEQTNGYGLLASPCNKLYKKALITSFFPEDIKNGEDAIFNLNYIQNCKKICLTNSCKYNYYYNNPNSLTKKYKESTFEDTIKVFKFLKIFVKNYGINQTYINRFLLRTICSISKSLIKCKNYPKKSKKEIIRYMFENIETRFACEEYVAIGIVEKIAFKLIKYKKINYFYICCSLK